MPYKNKEDINRYAREFRKKHPTTASNSMMRKQEKRAMNGGITFHEEFVLGYELGEEEIDTIL